MRFKVVVYNTKSANKFDAEDTFEYLGDVDSAWFLWFVLTKKSGYRHVEVFNLAG